ncbi:hypothetical protein [Bacillus thuringiensis]|uniref:hypothetical protein n=1 Tax=Bacillus thuringiensis TaxID=1428 RepID=UPI000B44FBEB|nr:hypothetical protein [Bacillus thuringiensis]MED3181419.1 hypothetical protein [Bacillus thuringiensis]OTY12904.1 hypothetical protein BK734_10280 [Bacillus thuringiensis serovar kim]OUB13686.1 hypothetical protein BK733_27555 [Bacillus thuringiensis serovar xiaguangiensis]HDR4482967.1 hypothetical protein [Bacillus cereus]
MKKEIFNYLSNDFFDFFGKISFTAAVFTVLYFLVKIAAQHIFNRNIAKYTGEINQELEKLKLQHQKTLKDFELYNSEKHKKYPEMYMHLETAYGHIYSLTGITKRFTFENVDEEDLKCYFKELNFTSFDTTRILQLWSDDKDSAKTEIATLEEKIRYGLASEKLNIANNYYIYNQLYFSKDVSDKCDDLLKDMQDYLTTLAPKYPLTSEIIKKQTEYKKEILPEKRLLVRSFMKKELDQS